MRSPLRSTLTVAVMASVAVLLSACGGGSGLDATAGRSTASKAQTTIKTMYDALVAAVGGDPTSGRGSFVNCGLGNNSLRWSFRGYLQGASGDDLVARAGEALIGAGFTRSTAGDTDRSRAHVERDGLAIVLDEDSANAGWLSILAETPCESYGTAAADELKSAAPWAYGRPLG